MYVLIGQHSSFRARAAARRHPDTTGGNQARNTRSFGSYGHKTYRGRFIQETFPAGQNVTASEICKVQIPFERPTEEVIVHFH